MTERRIGVGIVGAGFILDQYIQTLRAAPDVEVRHLASMHPERARARADEFGLPSAGSYADLLRDDSVDVVVNLTVPQVHAELTAQALDAGKHVWSEKPLALSIKDGRELLDLATARGLRLGCAPDTFLGSGLQTALRLIRSGRIGTPRSAFANFQYPGPNVWHPNPEFLFQAGGGPLLDMGPYYLTALVQVFGPIVRVSAEATTATPTRIIAKGPRAGERFTVEVPTHVSALYTFACGGVATVILSFDTPIRRVALEVAGTDGALALPDPNHFTGGSELFRPDGGREPITPTPPGGAGRGTGIVDLVRSIRAGEPHRTDARLAFHVLEAMLAAEESARTGRAVEITTDAEPASLLPSGWKPDR